MRARNTNETSVGRNTNSRLQSGGETGVCRSMQEYAGCTRNSSSPTLSSHTIEPTAAILYTQYITVSSKPVREYSYGVLGWLLISNENWKKLLLPSIHLTHTWTKKTTPPPPPPPPCPQQTLVVNTVPT